MKANMYVKDDTEVNAAGSSFQLTGSYFGYGDSTEKDDRKFTPVVDAANFQIEVTDAAGNKKTENRGHYNSSAIIVNGEQSTLNLAQAKTLFLAGRTYIELSKDVNSVDGTTREDDAVVNTVIHMHIIQRIIIRKCQMHCGQMIIRLQPSAIIRWVRVFH